MGVDELRASLKIGESIEDLVVVSKNPTSGLLIVANKRSPTKTSAAATAGSSGVSSRALNFDSIQVGQLIPGKAVSHTPQGTVIQLPNMLRGRVHPTDASDDLSLIAEGDGPLNIDDDVTCYVLKVNPHSRIIDLSTRKSRVNPSTAGAVVDPEIGGIDELKVGQAVRGLVKNVSPHGLFVALGRTATARVMIKEMFDEFVKDWQSRFEVNQLVSGKILTIDQKKGLVEMTLRKNTGKGAKKVAQLGLSEFSEGQKVEAVVKKVEAYGMFLQIEGSDVRGLCHKSEISDNKAQDVSAALKGFREGDKVKAMIVGIDREKGKISFGVKASYFDDEDFGGEDVDMNGDEEEQDGEMDEDEDEEEGDEEDEEEGDEEEDLTFEDGDEDEDEDEDEDDEDDVMVGPVCHILLAIPLLTRPDRGLAPFRSIKGGRRCQA
jgi:rRNA biogenesis protein RRP5